jgi:hypothetical protein
MKVFEPYINERIELAKAKAQKVLTNPETEEELLITLRLFLSRHYGMPLYDEYFLKRTLDELIFEIELVRGVVKDSVSKTSELLSSNKQEAEGLFDDWKDADISSSPELDKAAEEFMKTGNFKT